MKVAVIIVNYNDKEDTLKYVKVLNSYESINRIVVVDNMSTDPNEFEELKKLEDINEISLLAHEKISVIQSERNGGYNYGMNFGIKYLESNDEKFDYYIISNADIEVSEEAIRHSLSIANENRNIAVIAPRMFNSKKEPIRRSAWKERTFKLDLIHSTRLMELLFYRKFKKGEYSQEDFQKERLDVYAIAGAFFIIRVNFFDKMGYLDENVFLFYEEDILARKVREFGMKTISLNSEYFIHYESQTIEKSLNYYRKMKQMFNSKMYYHKTYNHINAFQSFAFYIFRFFRVIELIFEIPIRKILKK